MGSRLTDIEEVHKITEIILSMLEYDYENEASKVWVLDSLIKLSSVKNFNMHEQVKNTLNSFSKNFDIEICQRSLGMLFLMVESKKLARYNAALRLNNKLNFDEELSFLSGFVENARKNGAK